MQQWLQQWSHDTQLSVALRVSLCGLNRVLHPDCMHDSSQGTAAHAVSVTNHEAICRDLPSYHLRLPSKRIFSQQQSVEFVEERRQQLNGYLQSLLAIPPVASNDQHLLTRCRCLWPFLHQGWSAVS